MKINFSRVILFFVILIFLWFGIKIMFFSYRNFQGYCIEKNSIISEQEKINSAIEQLLSYYPKNEKDLKRFSDNENPSLKAQAGKIFIPIAYKNANEFRLLNNNCCTFTKKPDEIEDAPATLFDKITGAKSGFVNITYRLRYKDSLNENKEQKRKVTYAVTNCGVAWNNN